MQVAVTLKNVTNSNWGLVQGNLTAGAWQAGPPPQQLAAMNHAQWIVSGVNGRAGALVRFGTPQEFVEFAFSFQWTDVHNNSISTASQINIPGRELYSKQDGSDDNLSFTLVVVPKV